MNSKIRSVCGYVLFLLVITLIAGEIFVRIFLTIKPEKQKSEIPSKNPKLVYELNPDYPEINRWGMRQDEFSLEDLKDKFVVAVLGDSHTYATKVKNFKDSYPAQLNKQLEELGHPNSFVLNMGVHGYNTAIELEVLKSKIPQFHPNLVILQYTINDTHVCNLIQPHHLVLNSLLYKSWFLVWTWKEILYSHHGKRQLYPRIGKWLPDALLYEEGLVGTLKTRIGVDPQERLGHPQYLPEFVPERYHYMLGQENFEKHVMEFGQVAKQMNIPILATGFITKEMEPLFLKSGFKVYSFYDIFDGLDFEKDGGYNPKETSDHFTEKGNEIVARKLAEFISKNYFPKAA